MRQKIVLFWIGCLVVTGCAHVTPGEVVQGVAGFVAVQTARQEFVESCELQGEAPAVCESRFLAVQDSGRDLYLARKRAAERGKAEQLADSLDAFMNESPMPEAPVDTMPAEPAAD